MDETMLKNATMEDIKKELFSRGQFCQIWSFSDIKCAAEENDYSFTDEEIKEIAVDLMNISADEGINNETISMVIEYHWNQKIDSEK